ncbi:segregation/condensation protein A [Nanoarchaeota archaeon]
MQEKIYQMLFNSDDVTWQTMLYELVKKEDMDPWDIDVTAITKKYIEILKELKAHDFRVSGKVLLAAAILLRIKSNRLVGADLDQFDRMLQEPEEIEDVLDTYEDDLYRRDEGNPNLIPRTPQPRKRKVSIFDLVNALEKALEVKQRRVIQRIPIVMHAPEKTRDISEIIKDLYFKIKKIFGVKGVKTLRFSQLIPSDKKDDKVYTFIPLLHLCNQRKVDLNQEMHFGEIDVVLRAELEKQLK